MSIPADVGCRSKLARADTHLDALVKLLPTSDQYKITSQTNADGTARGWSLTYPQVDPLAGVIIGEFLHDLHSALDQWAWAAVDRHGTIPDTPRGRNRVQFPIYPTEPAYLRNRPDRLPGITDQAVLAAVDGLQPWSEGQDPDDDPLMWLHELSIADKHRTLHPVIAISEHREFQFPTGFNVVFAPNGPIESGAMFVALIGPGAAEVHMKPELTITNVIPQFGRLPYNLALRCLDHIQQHVRRALEDVLLPLL